MAQSLRNHAFAIPRTFLPISKPRYFSSVKPRQASPLHHPDADMRRHAMAQAHMVPSDAGLLPNTFITPPLRKQPSLFKSPKELAKFHWRRLKYRMKDKVALLALKFMSPRVGRLKFKVQLKNGEIIPTAKSLHLDMYNAFADGDIRHLRKICADGVFESFMARIAARRRGDKMHWERIRMNGRPKIMSHKAAQMQGEGDFIRQVVVRIASQQKLTRKTSNGAVVSGTGEATDVVEYLVLQKLYRKFQPDKWQVWGTTEETTWETLEEWEDAES